MTVKSWGTGRPDYMSSSIASRPQIIEEQDTQERWTYNNEYTISSQSSTEETIYTVPEGYNLALGLVEISASGSCINKIKVQRDTTTVEQFEFDTHGNAPFSSISGVQIQSGEQVNIKIWNNDHISTVFTLNMSGVLEKLKSNIHEVN